MATTTYVLRKHVTVAPDEARGMEPNELLELSAGTALSELHESERDQLAPGHFTDESGDTPKDWRPLDQQEEDHNVLERRAEIIAEGERANREQQAEQLRAERADLDAKLAELEGEG